MSEREKNAKAIAFDETLQKLREMQHEISRMEGEAGEYADEIDRLIFFRTVDVGKVSA